MRGEDRPSTTGMSILAGEEFVSDCTISGLGDVVEFAGDSKKHFSIKDGGGDGSVVKEEAYFFHDGD